MLVYDGASKTAGAELVMRNNAWRTKASERDGNWKDFGIGVRTNCRG